jgi:hypothetical protein
METDPGETLWPRRGNKPVAQETFPEPVPSSPSLSPLTDWTHQSGSSSLDRIDARDRFHLCKFPPSIRVNARPFRPTPLCL